MVFLIADLRSLSFDFEHIFALAPKLSSKIVKTEKNGQNVLYFYNQ